MKDETQPDAIVGRYEIAIMFGVTRQGVTSIINHPGFPAPICRQGKNCAPLFWRRDCEAFKRSRAQKTPASAAAA